MAECSMLLVDAERAQIVIIDAQAMEGGQHPI
jgi:hypothetical protein